MQNSLIERIGKKLSQARSVLLVSHIRPDGDAIGSLVGFGLALMDAGYSVQMVLRDGVPSNFSFLRGTELVKKSAKDDYDVSCVLDCSDIDRTGGVLKKIKPDINIDHHVTNLNFASINIVEKTAASTAEVVYEILKRLDMKISAVSASALLIGVITDTLGFRTSNMRPKTLQIAAELMELGADLPFLYHEALVRHSYEAVKFWGYGLAKLQRDGRLVWTALTMEDRKLANYPGKDDADIINVLSAIDSADVAIVFVEQPNGSTKVSWRAKPGFDVSKIALEFGGGGHKAAAGADIHADLETVKEKVLKNTKLILNGK